MSKVRDLILKVTNCYRKIRKTHVYGKNNIIPYLPKGMKIYIYGNNNKVIVDPSVKIFKGHIHIGDPSTYTSYCTVKIGRNCSSNGTDMTLFEDNSEIYIGDNCMFSWNIQIWNTDSHSIIDYVSGKAINIGKKIKIGNHVWVCMNSVILKNTEISSNSIIAANSVVSKKFVDENVIIAGNPAKIVKKGVLWKRQRVNDFIKTTHEL